MLKKVTCLILILFLLFTCTNITNASTTGDIIGGADNFVNTGKDLGKADPSNEAFDSSKLAEVSNLIYNTLLTIGIIILVIWGMILGIQFITGSVEQKVKVKESLITYIVGAIIILSAFGIWKLVISILK